MKQPCGSSVPKSSGRSARLRGQDAPRGAAGQVAEERVPVGHAAAILVDQLARRDPGRGELDAGLLDPARDREAAQPLAAVPALRP